MIENSFIARALENGDLDLAAKEKDSLENKQRDFRKPFKGKKEQDWWSPRWFEPSKHKVTGDECWKFKLIGQIQVTQRSPLI